MSGKIIEKDLTDFLIAIERGEIAIKPDIDPASVWCGNVPYTASNGWKITVFNDCSEWDYIDSVKSNDGRKLNYDDMADMHIAGEYRPSDEIAARIYLIS